VTEHFPSAHPSLSPAIMFTIPRNVLACVLLLLQASPPAMATRHAFDWNTGPGDGSVPARYSFGITATVGDTLVLSWQDPTTTPAGTMFHEVVRMADNSCNFANSYARARETDITNAAGVKTAVSSTITLDTVCPAAAHHHQTIRFNWDASLTSVCLASCGARQESSISRVESDLRLGARQTRARCRRRLEELAALDSKLGIIVAQCLSKRSELLSTLLLKRRRPPSRLASEL
jgi:hypothetical protein